MPLFPNHDQNRLFENCRFQFDLKLLLFLNTEERKSALNCPNSYLQQTLNLRFETDLNSLITLHD